LIEVFLLSNPTPTIGAPPKVAPGVPKAEPPPVVPAAFNPVVPFCPVVVVPPIVGDEPKPLEVPLFVLGSVLEEPTALLEEPKPVPPVGDVEEPLLPNAEFELLPKAELDEDDPNPDPLLEPNPDPVLDPKPDPVLEPNPLPVADPVPVIPFAPFVPLFRPGVMPAP
jgi:hypothetical protein